MVNLPENNKHLIRETASIKDALGVLNALEKHLTIFVINDKQQIIGSITDGDVRRGLLKEVDINSSVTTVMNPHFKFLPENKFTMADINEIKQKLITLIPILDEQNKLIRIIDFDTCKTVLPLDAIVMAGGEGKRLRPLTDTTPKPLLKVGGKPIIEYNIERLEQYGVSNVTVTINYLGDQLVSHFNNRANGHLQVSFVTETKPLGTIGAASLIPQFTNKHLLLMNSDLLTNIDFEDFYNEFIRQEADMAVATIPYKVDIPYGVLETTNNCITHFTEKPTYTYFSNAGIYLLKKELIDMIPRNEFYNATDLMEALIKNGRKVLSYPILSYWLDIGKHSDFEKAQEDIKHIRF